MTLRIAIIVLLLKAASPAGAQELAVPSTSGGKTLHIRKIEAQIKVDGKLDEPVWGMIPPVTDFVQTAPDQGAPVSERTEVRVFYDDHSLYFGFHCYDSQPAKVVARLGPHDGRTNSDSVNVLIDTFRDRRTGYFFSINSRGIQYDAVTNEAGGGTGFEIHDSSWDGIWLSATALEPWGYSVEVAIPFKSIRLARASEQTWGLNLSRDIVRKNESAYWAPVARYEGTMKPSKAGTLTGLEDLSVGRNLELIPFFGANYRRSNWRPELNGPSATAGLDARYGLAANLTANLTVNPDFADTEADEFTPTLSRYEIFFPEKRKFFTEGANYFSSPLQLFFSRRIGARLPDGTPQRILEGGKVTGKVDRWSIGALEALTQETNYVDPADGLRKLAPGAFFGVVRVQRDFLEKSAFGFISVNRLQGTGTVGQREMSHAVDLSVLHGPHVSWVSQAMVNTNSANRGISGQHVGWGSAFNYNSETWEYGAEGKFLGKKVDLSNTGFEPEVDRWAGEMRVMYKPFINRWGIRQIFNEFNYDESNDTSGALQDAGADYRFHAQFRNFWEAHFEHSYDRVRFYLFTPDFQRLRATRVYTTPIWRAWLSTNENGKLALTFKYISSKIVEYNENFYGIGKEFDLTTSARLGGHLRWELTAALIQEYLQTHVFYQSRRFLISRWNYQVTPRLRARILAQFADDCHGHDVSINSLVAYDFTARSALFIGYNRQRQIPLAPSDLGHELYLKLSYLVSF